MKRLDLATKNALLSLLEQEHRAYRTLEAASRRSRADETGRSSSKAQYEAWQRATEKLRSMCAEAFDVFEPKAKP